MNCAQNVSQYQGIVASVHFQITPRPKRAKSKRTPIMLSSEALHLPTLALVACVVVLTAAVIMTLVGMTQRTYRGYWLWTAAQWLNMSGAACLLLTSLSPWMLPLSALLSLQWPLTMLAGMRLFYASTSFRAPAWVDVLPPLLGAAAYTTVYFHNQQDVGARVAVFSLFNIVGYMYAAWQIQSIRDWRQSPYLKAVLWLLGLGSLIQLPRFASAMTSWGVPVADATTVQQPIVMLGLVIGVMFSVYMCLLLTYERSEHDLRESHQQLRMLADFDMLTQVPNRRHFNDLATQALNLGTPGSASLVALNIDQFKHLNDALGRAAGDEALQQVASTAREALCNRDVMGRLGGDEFMILLPNTALKDALRLADLMVRQLDQARSLLDQPTLSLSFGVVQIAADETLAQASSRASKVLLQAQAQHRASAHKHEAGDDMFGVGRPSPIGLTLR